MEDETNLISSSTTYLTTEDCDSSANNQFLPKKRKIHARERKAYISGSRFKGVVDQHNGHWGAQIYTNHQRIWLDTFKTEIEAAMAYDSAAIRLLGHDHSHRNLPWTNSTIQEPNFQSQFSTEDIFRMIKEGSYPSKFDEYLKEKFEEHFHPLKTLPPVVEVKMVLWCKISYTSVYKTIGPSYIFLLRSLVMEEGTEKKVNNICDLENKGNNEFSCKKLFQKELTPSDVGKLNRLVIAKKYALKYLPQIHDDEMIFYDTSRRLWKFRYCYWKSSQNFVFTKGWNKFVKDKSLRAKDAIIFNLCEFKNGTKENCNAFVIDVMKNNEVLPMDLALNHQQEDIDDDHEVETKEFMSRTQSFDHDDALVPVWLFGKQIGWTGTTTPYLAMEFN